MATPLHTPRRHTVFIGQHGRQGPYLFVKMSTTILEIKMTRQPAFAIRLCISAADNIQVRIPIDIRIEKHSIHPFAPPVPAKYSRIPSNKFSVGSLDQQASRLAPRATDKQVIQPILIDIRHRHLRPPAGFKMRNEVLFLKVQVSILPVLPTHPDKSADILERRLPPRKKISIPKKTVSFLLPENH